MRYNGQSCNASCIAPFEPITYEYVCVLARVDVMHLDDDLFILEASVSWQNDII